MPKIIDIPYGTYLAYVVNYDVSQDYLDLTLDIAYGEWRGYFATKDRVLMPQVPSGAYRRKISYAAKTAEIVSNAIGNNKTVVAIVIGEQKYGTENKYHNITDVVDWRTCDTLSPDARAWAEQHFDDNVYDNTPTAYDMLPYALQYAQAGLRVFPLSPCDKTPLRGTSGCKEATDDISQVTKWWFDNPFCNIGIATGNGIVVIDVDEGEGKSGEASIGQWQSINGKLPDTITSITGKGGRHIIYKSDCDYNNRVGIIPNVDIRGIGGYIVAPPSVHPNGTRYKWASTFNPTMISMVDKLLQTDLGNTVPANKLNSDSNIINFRNGLLHLDSMELTEHSPSVYSTIQLPCSWNPSPSPCPVFDSFLSSISSNNAEMVKLLTEYIGYAVSNVPGYLTKKALFLYGPGNTGKSQYLSLLEKLVGNDNYCSITLQALEMRFGTASLFGKRVAGAADMGSATIRELEKFKSITGGDIIDFEFKGKDKFNARYNGLFCLLLQRITTF